MTAFFGTAATCVVLTVSSLLRWHRPGGAILLVGSLLYLFGTILVTIVFNVPRNEALEAVDPASRIFTGRDRAGDQGTGCSSQSQPRTLRPLCGE